MQPTLPEAELATFEADRALVRDTLRGDRRAIEAFVDRLCCVPRYLRSRNRRWGAPLDEHELCDLVQDVMELLWRKRPTYRGLGSLEGWACGTSLLQFYNRVRRRRRAAERDTPHLAEEAGREPPDVAMQLLVREALAELPERERRVIEAKHFEDRSFTEIGEVLGMPPSTAKTCYYRGLEALRRLLPTPFGDRES